MHPVQCRQLVTVEETGSRHVGGNHALLDEAVSIVAWNYLDAIDLAIKQTLDPGLLKQEGPDRRVALDL